MTTREFYEQERLKGNTEDITGNPNPDYNNRFYSEIFDLMSGYFIDQLKGLVEDSEQIHTEYIIDRIKDEISCFENGI
jgi:hypothetical protein